MKKKNEKYYLDKDELWSEIKKFYEDDSKMSNKLGDMITSISEKLMTSQNFSGYPYKQEMIGDAILKMVSTISEKKFNLWSNKKCKMIEERFFNGYMFNKDYPLEEGQVLHVKNMNSLKIVNVFEKTPNIYYHDFDSDGNIIRNDVWEKVKVAKGLSIVPTDDTAKVLKINTFVDSDKEFNGRMIYKSDVVYDNDGNIVQEKSNAFGYLSLISQHEAITRIKKEKRNTETIKSHQEDEFVEFMAEHCEMSPQRIFDDSYEIDNN